MLEDSHWANVSVSQLSFARALTETRLFLKILLSPAQQNHWPTIWTAFVTSCTKYRIKIKPNRHFSRNRQEYLKKSRGLERKRRECKPKETNATPSSWSRPETLKNRRDGVYLLN